MSDFDPEDLEDLEIEVPDEDESSAGAKLRALMKKYPGLEYSTRGADGSKLDSPIKAIKQLNQVMEELTTRDVRSFERPGYSAKPAFLEILGQQVDKLKDALRKNFDQSELSDFELDVFARVIAYNNLTGSFQAKAREFSARATASELISKYGVSVSNPNGVAIKKFKFSATASGDSYRPAGGDSDYSKALDAIDAINNFFESGQGSLPSSLDPDALDISFIDNPDEFATIYKQIGGKESAKYVKANVLGSNGTRRPGGSLGTQDQLKDLESKLIFNLALIRKSNPEFGTSTIMETIFHEYGHSIHRAIGLGFLSGPRSPLSNFQGSELTARYREARKEFVSQYGDGSPTEHFSESFSKYLATGQGSPAWVAFMRDIGIIKD